VNSKIIYIPGGYFVV